jgi:hypothetical protein
MRSHLFFEKALSGISQVSVDLVILDFARLS